MASPLLDDGPPLYSVDDGSVHPGLAPDESRVASSLYRPSSSAPSPAPSYGAGRTISPPGRAAAGGLDLSGLGELGGKIQDWLFGPEPNPQQRQDQDLEAARRFYEQYRAGDKPAFGGPVADTLRRILGQPAPQPAHPEMPGFGQLTPTQQWDTQKAYDDYQKQQREGQGGVFQGFPSPVELGVRTARETPLKPVVQKGEEIHEAIRQQWYNSARSEGVTQENGQPLPPWEQATPAQQAWGSFQGQAPFLKAGMSAFEAPDLAAAAGLGRIGVDAARAQLRYNQLAHAMSEGVDAGAAAFAREAVPPEPYQGRNLGRQRAGATDFGDYAGFFTASELSHAEHYATVQEGQTGEIYREGEPQQQRHLVNDGGPVPANPALSEPALSTTMAAAGGQQLGRVQVQDVTGPNGDVMGRITFDVDQNGVATIHEATMRGGENSIGVAGVQQLARELLAKNPQITSFADGQGTEQRAMAARRVTGGGLGFMGAGDVQALGAFLAQALNAVIPRLGEASFGGQVESARDLAMQLRQLPPEAWQGYAGRHIDELSQQLQQQLGTASQDKIERTMMQLGTYERAMRDAVGGRDDPTTEWADQLANHASDRMGLEEIGQLAQQQGPILRRMEGNLLMKKLQGWETAAINLLDGWARAAEKAHPTRAERESAIYEVAPTLAARRPSPLAGPLRQAPEPGSAPPPPGSAMAPLPEGTQRRVPPVIQQLMDEEIQVPGGQTFHLNEEQAYAAAQARGLWPVEQSPYAPMAGPPERGTVGLHDITVKEPAPVEVTPQAKEFGRAISSLLTRVGLSLVDDRHLLKALRAYYYPLLVSKGPGGETGIEAMEAMLNPGRRHPWNPDDPHFHRRVFETLDAAEQAGFTVVRDPAVVVPLYLKAVYHAMANQMSLEYLEGAVSGHDGRRMLFDQAERPFDANHPELYRDYRELITDDFKSGHAWLHPDTYGGLRSQLESAAVKNELGRAFIRYQQFDRNVAMWNPLFHGLNLLAHGLMGSIVPLRLAFLGGGLSKDPAIVRDIDSWIHAVPARSVWEDEIAVLQGKIPELRDPLSVFGMLPGNLAEVRSLPGRWESLSGRFLWEGMKRNQQRAAFVLMRDRAMGNGFNRDQASAIAGVFADRMVGAQDPRTKVPLERTVTPYVFFAYNWTKTHVMQLFESLPVVGGKVLGKEHPFLTPEMANWLQGQMLLGTARSLVSAFLYTQMLQLTLSALDGQPKTTFDNENGEKFALDVTPIAKWLGIATGGKRVYLPSPFLRFFDWYRQAWEDISDHGLRGGSLEFLKNKLMAPIPGVLDQVQHPEWGSAEGLRHFVTGGEIATGGILPLTTQLARIGAPNIIAGGQNDLSVGRALLGTGAMALGSNPPSYGPKPGRSIPPDAQQERNAALYLLQTQGISWPSATPDQKLKAVDAIKDELIGQSTQRAAAYQRTEQQAVIDEYRAAGINDPEGTYKRQVDQGRSPFDELDKIQKREIFDKHPELEAYHQVPSNSPDAKVRDVENQTTGYYAALKDVLASAKQQQQQDDLLLRQGQIDEFTWRSRRSSRQQSIWDSKNGYVAALVAAYPQALTTLEKSNAFRQAHGQAARVPPAVDVAYQQYQNISLDDPKYQLADGSFDSLSWRADRDRFLNSLPHDVQTRIHQFERLDRTPVEQAYQAMVSQYSAFELQHRAMADLYRQIGQLSNNPRARARFETLHPQLRVYTQLRNLWFQQHPLAAFWFQGGSGLQTTLQRAGVNPLGNPGQQFSQLLTNPLVEQQLRSAGVELSPLQQGAARQNLTSAFEPAAFGQSQVQSAPFPAG